MDDEAPGSALAALVAEAFSADDPELEAMLIALLRWRLVWRRRPMFHHWRRHFINDVGYRLAILVQARPMIDYLFREVHAAGDGPAP